MHLTPAAPYTALDATDMERQSAYRAFVRAQLDVAASADIRLAVSQNQPLGNARFRARIEQVTGERREARPRGRPRAVAVNAPRVEEQWDLEL